jgi:hypothetical protein
MGEKQEYYDKMSSLIAEISRRINDLREEARSSGDPDHYSESIKELEQKGLDYMAKLEELLAAEGDDWTGLKGDVEDAWEDIQDQYKRAKAEEGSKWQPT